MNHKIGKQFVKIGFLFLALMALVGGIVIPASAAPNATPNAAALHTVEGQIQSISSPGLVLLTTNKQAMTINTDGSTLYYAIPIGKVQGYVNNQTASDNRADKKAGVPVQSPAGQLKELHIPANWRSDLGWLATFDAKANFSNIAVGDRVIVRADSTNLAKQIMIIKAPVNRTVKGGIVLTDPTHITITPAGAAAMTLNVTATTQIILKGVKSISGYASALYNSSNNNALVVNIQAAAPAPAATAAIPPSVGLTSIALAPVLPANLVTGGTQQFTATATYSNGTTNVVTTQVTWTSSDPTKATVTLHGGLATAVAAGPTNITASLIGIISPAVTLAVVAPVTLTSIAVTPNPASVHPGSTQQFTATGAYSNGTSANITTQVTWVSSDPTKATITSPGGLATGIAVGTTNVTASLSAITGPAIALTVVSP